MANTIPGVDPLVAEAGSPLLPLALLFTSTTTTTTTTTPPPAPEISSFQPVSNQISEIPTTSVPTIREPEAILIGQTEEQSSLPPILEPDEKHTKISTMVPSTNTIRSTTLSDTLPENHTDDLPNEPSFPSTVSCNSSLPIQWIHKKNNKTKN